MSASHGMARIVLDVDRRHTIASGAVNAAFTALSAALVATAVVTMSIVQTVAAIAFAAAMVLIALIVIIASPDDCQGRMVVRAGYVAVLGMWVIAYVAFPGPGTLRYLAVLAVITAVGWAGMAVVDRRRRPDTVPDAGNAAPDVPGSRDAIAVEWTDRIRRVLRLDVVIVAVEYHPQRTKAGEITGFTLETRLPEGGVSWVDISRRAHLLTADAALGTGCSVAVSMGANRRVALVDVTVVDMLMEDAEFPMDGLDRPLSIHDGLVAMVARDGTRVGMDVRSYNAVVVGAGGSGKSNFGQVAGAQLARMNDVLVCDIDLTGGQRFSGPLLWPFIEGRAENPAVFWSGYSHREARLMLRALSRAARARNTHYGQLKRQANDDKMPIGVQYPAFVIRADEIAHVAGRTADPEIRELVREMVADHRDPGVRAVLLGLRSTDDTVVQGIEAHMHHRGVLRVNSPSEYRNLMGGGSSPPDVMDAPYPGCVHMSVMGEPVRPCRVWRITPDKLDAVAVAASVYQPQPDKITWNALNGRNPDGSVMDGVEPDEVDCCATRWERYRRDSGVTAAAPKRPPSAAGAARKASAADAAVDEHLAGFDEIIDRVRSRNEGRRERVDEINAEFDKAGFDAGIDDFLSEVLSDSVNGGETMTREQAIIAVVDAAGDAGVGASEVAARLRDGYGIRADRSTVYRWLEAVGRGGSIEWRPHRDGGTKGRWYPASRD